MRTTPEERVMMRAALADGVYADLNPDEVRDVLSLLDDLDEALADVAALRAVAEAARAALDAEDSSPVWWPTLRTLERALRAWEERER